MTQRPAAAARIARKYRAGRGATLRPAFQCLWLSIALLLAPVGGANADILAAPWRALPWHLVDYHHKFPPTGIFRSLSMDMTLRGRVDPGASLYLSPLWGKLDETGFYFGFVSDLSGPRGRRLVGKGLLFSRWGKGRKSDTRTPDGAWAYIGDKRTSGEGDFVSVRRAFEWGQGRYSFKLTARPDPAATWVDLAIIEHRTGARIDGGGLRFPGSGLKLQKTLVSFVELFPPHGKGKWTFPKTVPRLDVAFRPVVVNDTFGPVAQRVHFPKKVPRLVQVHDDGFEFNVSLGRIPLAAALNDNTSDMKEAGSK